MSRRSSDASVPARARPRRPALPHAVNSTYRVFQGTGARLAASPLPGVQETSQDRRAPNSLCADVTLWKIREIGRSWCGEGWGTGMVAALARAESGPAGARSAGQRTVLSGVTARASPVTCAFLCVQSRRGAHVGVNETPFNIPRCLMDYGLDSSAGHVEVLVQLVVQFQMLFSELRGHRTGAAWSAAHICGGTWR